MKYYLVIAKGGHVGRNNYIRLAFPIKAKDGKEAANIAKRMPRVKHDHKDVIQCVKELNKEEYLEAVKVYRNNPYFKVTSVQEQRAMCPNIYDEVIKEKSKVTYKKTHVRRRLVENEIIKGMTKYKQYEDE